MTQSLNARSHHRCKVHACACACACACQHVQTPAHCSLTPLLPQPAARGLQGVPTGKKINPVCITGRSTWRHTSTKCFVRSAHTVVVRLPQQQKNPSRRRSLPACWCRPANSCSRSRACWPPRIGCWSLHFIAAAKAAPTRCIHCLALQHLVEKLPRLLVDKPWPGVV